MGTYKIEPGNVYPLGAQVHDNGVNFALFSEHAEKVELCLFDEHGKQELMRIALPCCEHNVWHGFLRGAEAGLIYGYRVYGAYQPTSGHRFNHHKLLLDPYAKKFAGKFQWSNRHYGYQSDNDQGDLSFDDRDNASVMLKAVVTTDSSPNQPRNPIPWQNTIIYEGHVKGLTQLNPKVPEELRGSFRGVSHPSMLAHYKSLGITTIELLPVHHYLSEPFLKEKQLSNYWGYNSIGFFVPHTQYLNGQQISDFQIMVDELHQAGFEVILDVVYNHTAEGDQLGPTLSFRGIDNRSYYRLNPKDPRFYINDTGCGNTVNINHPRVLQLVMDSLRYWVVNMGVDGFRFDLATILGREEHGFDAHGSFLNAVAQDPILNTVKLIAEPWDIGPGGYQVGAFPSPWSEWNDQYRDTIRRFWRGDKGMVPAFASRIHGSSDLYEHNGRKPSASINLITSHDGYTLHDLVSYEERHNEANGEDNRDGHTENLSVNFGEEGDTENSDVIAKRLQQLKNFLTTLMLSQGVPMILGGDESGRTQQGNNNAYCQDNEINWLSWTENKQYAKELLPFIHKLTSIRKNYPMFAHRQFIHDNDVEPSVCVHWYHRLGHLMQKDNWHEQGSATLGYLIEDKANTNNEEEGVSESLKVLCIYHGGEQATDFTLPDINHVTTWQVLVDTTAVLSNPPTKQILANSIVALMPFSCLVLTNDHKEIV